MIIKTNGKHRGAPEGSGLGGGGAKVHESSVLEKNVTVRKKLMF